MKLNRSAYRGAIIVHVASSLAWLGLALCLLALGITTLTTTDPGMQYAAGRAAAMLATTIAVPIGALALASGVLLMLGTRWTVRYRWVLVKLLATAVIYTLTVFLLGPGLAETAEGLDPGRLALLDQGVVMGPIVSSSTFIALTAISYIKPWGRIGAATPKPAPRRRRALADSAR
ncbi:DUF2269 domain-containing protein [Glycomyces buryatensis]|uniref:DUF2269 domain-containing protein n=1 Tax=Glycomyces buryatensis TaxID=2570927 RepID=A0A4S8PQN1_9ACTN|nr:DUF2269 domain-containing protein [Glycomyces buryatensis]THV33463.1 DUF2269 domain-containing protein [Glycomyces buryatensis]